MSEQLFGFFSFVISVGLGIAFFASDRYKNYKYKQNVKNIIGNNILYLVKIFNRIHSDVEELDENYETNQRKAEEMAMYFEQKHTRIQMIRLNIENQLTHIAKDDVYQKNISEILEDIDVLLEICYNPKLPLKYQLSIWGDKQERILDTTKNTIDVARDNLKIELQFHKKTSSPEWQNSS